MPVKFTVNIGSRDVTVSTGDGESVPATLRVALERMQIVQRWEKAQRIDISLEAATRRFLGVLKRQGLKVSRSTLYLWVRRYKRDGLDGLMDGRRDKTTAAADGICRVELARCAGVLKGQQLAMLTMFGCILAGRRRNHKASPGTKENTLPQSMFEAASKGD